MSEENNELMTNRQLSQLCAKGLCEWCSKEYTRLQIVHNDYKYLLEDSDAPVSDKIIIRPFEKVAFTDADENTWYTPTKQAFTALIGGDKARHIFGF
jgi:hypothetical protein